MFCESEGWWFKSPPGQYFYHGCFFITPRSCMVFCKTFYYQEMARIYPPNAQNSECQIFYFLTFSAERSKFLERTLGGGETRVDIPLKTGDDRRLVKWLPWLLNTARLTSATCLPRLLSTPVCISISRRYNAIGK